MFHESFLFFFAILQVAALAAVVATVASVMPVPHDRV